eukprot:NP_001040828.1 Uncharacterized protein CELE_ZK1290.15 [Caenorhabditis elegans]
MEEVIFIIFLTENLKNKSVFDFTVRLVIFLTVLINVSKKVLKIPGAELSPFYYYCRNILSLVFCILFVILHNVLKTFTLSSRKTKKE